MSLDATIGGGASDTYLTLAEWQAYLAARGITPTGDDAAQEVSLRKAAQAMDVSYSFVGYRSTYGQAREWPRSYNGMVDGYYIGTDEIPQRVKDAQSELAYMIHTGSDPLANFTGGVKREKVDVLEVEYTDGGPQRERYTAVERLLRPFLAFGAGQVAVTRG